MPYLSCKKIENDVYNFPTWQYCKYKDIFDSRIIINSTAKFYISISYQKDLLSIDTRIFKLDWKFVQFWKFFIFIALRHWLQLVKFQIKSSTSLRWNDLKLWNFQLSQALPEEKMTTNYKNANQVKPSPKEGWLQITKTQIKSSISVRWDDLKS